MTHEHPEQLVKPLSDMKPVERALARSMLALSLAAYRASDQRGPVESDLPVLRQSLLAELAAVAPLVGTWDLVWGPGFHRPLARAFDDSLMYVVRRLPLPGEVPAAETPLVEEYAVVIRGTNPYSIWDWIFNDLMVDVDVPWVYNTQARAAGARLSLSSSLGLAILQAMQVPRAIPELPCPPPGRDGTPPSDDERQVQQELTVPSHEQLAERLERSRERYDEHPVAKLLGKTAELTGHEIHSLLLKAFEASAWVRGVTEGGERWTLLDFLRETVERTSGKINIYVTGHSKGGALAPSLAQLLADSQGPDAPEALRWDPSHKVTLSSVAFAGPTPGNEAWTRHFEQTFGDRGLRVANTLDLVTHAWQPDDIRNIPSLYTEEDSKVMLEVFTRLTPIIADDVAEHHYRHANCNAYQFAGDLARGYLTQELIRLLQEELDQGRADNQAQQDELLLWRWLLKVEPFLAKVVFRHVCAYAQAFDLYPAISLGELFFPGK